jgi:hypothetical protein
VDEAHAPIFRYLPAVGAAGSLTVRPDGQTLALRTKAEAEGGADDACDPAELHAWLYKVDQDGISRAMWDTTGKPMQTVTSDASLHITTEGGQNTPTRKCLSAARGGDGIRARHAQVG